MDLTSSQCCNKQLIINRKGITMLTILELIQVIVAVGICLSLLVIFASLVANYITAHNERS